MKLSRRAFLQSSMAGLAASATGTRGRAQDRFDQDALLAFWNTGTVTLVHVGDLQGQMMPHLSRPAERHLSGMKRSGGNTDAGSPYLTGEAFRVRYGIGGGSPMDYAFTHDDFAAHAGYYGPIGGLDRVASVLQAIRAARPTALFLTGANNGLGGLPDHPPLGQHTADVLSTLNPLRMAQATTLIERGGVKIGLIRTPAANTHLPWQIEDAHAQGAELLICLSENGLAADQQLARDIPGIDVILSNASQTALPEPFVVGPTRIIASGTQGRFVSRVDLDVQDGQIVALEHKLIPMFADLIRPDAKTAARIAAARAPFKQDLAQIVGQAGALLFTQGALTSTWEDVICAALMAQYGVQIALVPGFGWGNSVLPNQNITREDLYSLCGTAPARTYVRQMSGAALKNDLEDAVDNHLLARSAHFMPRVGGVGFSLDVEAKRGERISDMVLFEGQIEGQSPVELGQTYAVAGWGRPRPGETGAPLWQVLESFIRHKQRVGGKNTTAVTLAASK